MKFGEMDNRERLLEGTRKSRWAKVISVLASITVFCTTYAMVLPAITMSNQDALCGWVEHEHDDTCYNDEGEVICGLEPHVHTLQCYSDMEADIENHDIWDMENPDLTGDRNADVVNVAASLIGYRESDRNYLVSDGQTRGYTRFGHWYGDMEDEVIREAFDDVVRDIITEIGTDLAEDTTGGAAQRFYSEIDAYNAAREAGTLYAEANEVSDEGMYASANASSSDADNDADIDEAVGADGVADADSAQNADKAANADTAQDAGLAVGADFAQGAEFAANADSAQGAEFAADADSARDAGFAANADSAQTADAAAVADFAQSAEFAANEAPAQDAEVGAAADSAQNAEDTADGTPETDSQDGNYTISIEAALALLEEAAANIGSAADSQDEFIAPEAINIQPADEGAAADAQAANEEAAADVQTANKDAEASAQAANKDAVADAHAANESLATNASADTNFTPDEASYRMKLLAIATLIEDGRDQGGRISPVSEPSDILLGIDQYLSGDITPDCAAEVVHFIAYLRLYDIADRLPAKIAEKRVGMLPADIVEGHSQKLSNGIPAASYDDWNAMFVSYVLNFAQVYDMGAEVDAGNWAGALAMSGRYADAADYIPEPGDLVFFTPWDGADTRVGIVSQVNKALFGLGSVKSISVILGDEDNEVQEIRVAVGDVEDGDVIFHALQGYGIVTPRDPEEVAERDNSHVDSIVDFITGLVSPGAPQDENVSEEAAKEHPEDGRLEDGLAEGEFAEDAANAGDPAAEPDSANSGKASAEPDPADTANIGAITDDAGHMIGKTEEDLEEPETADANAEDGGKKEEKTADGKSKEDAKASDTAEEKTAGTQSVSGASADNKDNDNQTGSAGTLEGTQGAEGTEAESAEAVEVGEEQKSAADLAEDGTPSVTMTGSEFTEDGTALIMNWNITAQLPEGTLPAGAVLRIDTATGKLHTMTVAQAKDWAGNVRIGGREVTFADTDTYALTFIGGNGLLYSWEDVEVMKDDSTVTFTGIHVKVLSDDTSITSESGETEQSAPADENVSETEQEALVGESLDEANQEIPADEAIRASENLLEITYQTTAFLKDANNGHNYYVTKASVDGRTATGSFIFENGNAVTMDQNLILRDANLDETGHAAKEPEDVDDGKAANQDASATADNLAKEEEPKVGNPAAYEAQAGTLIAEGSDYKVTMTYDEEAGIPKAAKLRVTEIRKGTKEYKLYIAKAKEAIGLGENEEIELGGRFFDIKIMTKDGEFEPKAPVRVEIAYQNALEAEDPSYVNAVHFGEEEATQLDIEAETTDDGVKGVGFDTESFSVYGVVYIVDFGNEVNGRIFTFSALGGTEIDINQMVIDLGVAQNEVDAEEAVRHITEITCDVDGLVSVDLENKTIALTGADKLSQEAIQNGKAILAVNLDDGRQFAINLTLSGKPDVEAGEIARIRSANGTYLPEKATGSAEVVEKDSKAIAAVEKLQENEKKSEATAAGAVDEIDDTKNEAGKEDEAVKGAIEPEEDEAAKEASEPETDKEADTRYQVFDIELKDVDLKEYDSGFEVGVMLPESIIGKDFHLYHIHNGKTEEIKDVAISGTENKDGTRYVTGFSFVTEDFSDFVLSYTVDFYYGDYEYHLPGNGQMLLSELFEALAMDEKVTDVSSVVFSDPSLLEVYRVNEDISEHDLFPPEDVAAESINSAVDSAIGGESEAASEVIEGEGTLSASVEGSDNEPVYEIVKAGDWVLKSLVPFTTLEMLTITFTDNRQIIIDVTDAVDNHFNGIWSLEGSENSFTPWMGQTSIPHSDKLNVSVPANVTNKPQSRDASFTATLDFKLNQWTLNNLKMAKTPTLTYDLREFIKDNPLADLTDTPEQPWRAGNSIVGKYWIKDNVVYLQFTDKRWLQKQNTISGDFQMRLSLDEDKLGTADQWDFEFPGTGKPITLHFKELEYSATKDYSFSGSNDWGTGTVLIDEVEDGGKTYYEINYTATFTTPVDLTTLEFDDNLSGNQQLKGGSVTVTYPDGTTVTPSVTSSGQDFSFTLQGSNGSKLPNGKYTVTYTTRIEKTDSVPAQQGSNSVTTETNKATWRVNGDKNIEGPQTELKPVKPRETRPPMTVDKESNQSLTLQNPGNKEIEYTVKFGEGGALLYGKNEWGQEKSVTISDSMTDIQKLKSGTLKISWNKGDTWVDFPAEGIKWNDDNTYSMNPTTVFSYEIKGTNPDTPIVGPVWVKYTTEIISDEEAKKAGIYGSVISTNTATADGVSDQVTNTVQYPPEPPQSKTISTNDRDSDGSLQYEKTYHYTLTYGNEGENMAGVHIKDVLTALGTVSNFTIKDKNNQTVTIPTADNTYTEGNGYRGDLEFNGTYSTNQKTLFDYIFPEGSTVAGPIKIEYDFTTLSKADMAQLENAYGSIAVQNTFTVNNKPVTTNDMIPGNTPMSVDKSVVVTRDGSPVGDGEQWKPGDRMTYTIVFGSETTLMDGVTISDSMVNLQTLLGTEGNASGVKYSVAGGTLQDMPKANNRWGDGVRYSYAYEEKGKPSADSIELFNYKLPSGTGYGPVTVTYTTQIVSEEDAHAAGIWGIKGINNTARTDKGGSDSVSGSADYGEKPPVPHDKLVKVGNNGEEADTFETIDQSSQSATETARTLHYALTYGDESTDLTSMRLSDNMVETQELHGDVIVTLYDEDGTTVRQYIKLVNATSGDRVMYSSDKSNWSTTPQNYALNTSATTLLDMGSCNWLEQHTPGTYSTNWKQVFNLTFNGNAGVGKVKIEYDTIVITSEQAKANNIFGLVDVNNTFETPEGNDPTNGKTRFPDEPGAYKKVNSSQLTDGQNNPVTYMGASGTVTTNAKDPVDNKTELETGQSIVWKPSETGNSQILTFELTYPDGIEADSHINMGGKMISDSMTELGDLVEITTASAPSSWGVDTSKFYEAVKDDTPGAAWDATKSSPLSTVPSTGYVYIKYKLRSGDENTGYTYSDAWMRMPTASGSWNSDGVTYEYQRTGNRYSDNELRLFNFRLPDDAYGPVNVYYQVQLPDKETAWEAGLTYDHKLKNTFSANNKQAVVEGTVPFEGVPVHKSKVEKTAYIDADGNPVFKDENGDWPEGAEPTLDASSHTVSWVIKVDKTEDSSWPLANVVVTEENANYNVGLWQKMGDAVEERALDYRHAVVTTESGTTLTPGRDYAAEQSLTGRTKEVNGKTIETGGQITFSFDTVNEPLYITITENIPVDLIGAYEVGNKVSIRDDGGRRNEDEVKITGTNTELIVNKTGKMDDSDNRLITWTVVLNPARTKLDSAVAGAIMFKDYLGEGIELAKGAMEGQDISVKYEGKSWAGPLYFTAEELGNEFFVSDIRPRSWDGNPDSSVTMSEQTITVIYKTRITDEGFNAATSSETGSGTFENTAEFSDMGDNTFSRQGEVELTIDDALDKKDVSDVLPDKKTLLGDDIKYEIDVNKKGYMLNNGKTLTLFDSIPTSMDLRTGESNLEIESEDGGEPEIIKTPNVAVYVQDPDGIYEFADTPGVKWKVYEDARISYNDDTRMLMFSNLQDQTFYKACFTCRVRSLSGEEDTEGEVFDNTAMLKGNGSFIDTVSQEHFAYVHSANVYGSLSMLKVDENNINKVLPGAKFKLYEIETEPVEWETVENSVITGITDTWQDEYLNTYYRVADASGNLVTMYMREFEHDNVVYKTNSAGCRIRKSGGESGEAFGEKWKVVTSSMSDANGCFTSDEDGVAAFGDDFFGHENESFKFNTLYAWVEEEAPESYHATTGEPHYFVLYADDQNVTGNKIAAWELDNAWQVANDIPVASLSNKSVWTATNSQTRSIVVQKKWADDYGNTYDTRPKSVSLTLMQKNTRTGEVVKYEAEGIENPVLLTDGGNPNTDIWPAYMWQGLPVMDEEGAEYLYYVAEDNVAGYHATYDDGQQGIKQGTITVTNTLLPSTTQISVKKVWDDGNSAARPNGVTVNLLQILTDTDGNVGDPTTPIGVTAPTSAVLDGGNNWTYTFTGLPTKGKDGTYTYTVEEVMGDASTDGSLAKLGYTATYSDNQEGVVDSTITITNTQTGKLQITKAVTVNGQEGNRTDADGTYYFQVKDSNGKVVKTISISITNGIAKSQVIDLPAGTYTVHEMDASNGTALVGRNDVEVQVLSGDNGQVPIALFKNNIDTNAVTVTKEWINGGQGWPEERVTAGGTDLKNVTVYVTLLEKVENGSPEWILATRPKAYDGAWTPTLAMDGSTNSVGWTDLDTSKEYKVVETDSQGNERSDATHTYSVSVKDGNGNVTTNDVAYRTSAAQSGGSGKWKITNIETTEYPVIKKFSTAPDKAWAVTFQLLRRERQIQRNGASVTGSWGQYSLVDPTVTGLDSIKTVNGTANSDTADKVTFAALPKYRVSGTNVYEYEYSVKETNVTVNDENATSHYTASEPVWSEVEGAYIVTNEGSVTLPVQKVWSGGFDFDSSIASVEFAVKEKVTNTSTIPETVTELDVLHAGETEEGQRKETKLTLTAEGEKASVKGGTDNAWRSEFTGLKELPAASGGVSREYVIHETAITYKDGTVVTGSAIAGAFGAVESMEDGYKTITNTFQTVDVPAKKSWSLESGSTVNTDNLRVYFTLYNTVTGSEVMVTQDVAGDTLLGQAAVAASGDQPAVPMIPVKNPVILTPNVPTVASTSIYSTGSETESVQYGASDSNSDAKNWNNSVIAWTNLPKYSIINGALVENNYIVKETKVEEYDNANSVWKDATAQFDNSVQKNSETGVWEITNSEHVGEKTSLTVSKKWYVNGGEKTFDTSTSAGFEEAQKYAKNFKLYRTTQELPTGGGSGTGDSGNAGTGTIGLTIWNYNDTVDFTMKLNGAVLAKGTGQVNNVFNVGDSVTINFSDDNNQGAWFSIGYDGSGSSLATISNIDSVGGYSYTWTISETHNNIIINMSNNNQGTFDITNGSSTAPIYQSEAESFETTTQAEEVTSFTLPNENSFTKTFSNLKKYVDDSITPEENRVKYNYFVVEQADDGSEVSSDTEYSFIAGNSSASNPSEYGTWTVSNKAKELKVQKDWQNLSGGSVNWPTYYLDAEHPNEPVSIGFQVYRDVKKDGTIIETGTEPVYQTNSNTALKPELDSNESNGYAKSAESLIIQLPAGGIVNGEAVEYIYRVVEAPNGVAGTSSATCGIGIAELNAELNNETGNTANSPAVYKITNKLADVQVEKVWKDAEGNVMSTPPAGASAKMQLYRRKAVPATSDNKIDVKVRVTVDNDVSSQLNNLTYGNYWNMWANVVPYNSAVDSVTWSAKKIGESQSSPESGDVATFIKTNIDGVEYIVQVGFSTWTDDYNPTGTGKSYGEINSLLKAVWGANVTLRNIYGWENYAYIDGTSLSNGGTVELPVTIRLSNNVSSDYPVHTNSVLGSSGHEAKTASSALPPNVEEVGEPITLPTVSGGSSTWNHTWNNLPMVDPDGDAYEYYVFETDAAFDDSNYPNYTISTTYGKNGVLANDGGDGTKTVSVTNKLESPKYGSLQVTKTVQGADGSKNTFHIQIKDSRGNLLEYPVNEVNRTTFDIKAGQTLSFNDILVGTYTVEELDDSGRVIKDYVFDVDGSETSKTATVTESGTVNVTLLNKYYKELVFQKTWKDENGNTVKDWPQDNNVDKQLTYVIQRATSTDGGTTWGDYAEYLTFYNVTSSTHNCYNSKDSLITQNGRKFTVSKLPGYEETYNGSGTYNTYAYKVVESNVDGYSTTYSTSNGVTTIFNWKNTEFKARKWWIDSNNSSNAPSNSSVKLKLKRKMRVNGEWVEDSVFNGGDTYGNNDSTSVVLDGYQDVYNSTSNGEYEAWDARWLNLPSAGTITYSNNADPPENLTASGTFTYYVEETAMKVGDAPNELTDGVFADGFWMSSVADATGAENEEIDQVVTNEYNKTNLSVTKHWEDASGNAMTWPANSEITLKVDRVLVVRTPATSAGTKIGEDAAIGTITLKPDGNNGWTKTLTGFGEDGTPNSALITSSNVAVASDVNVGTNGNYAISVRELPKTGKIGEYFGEWEYRVTEEKVAGFSEPEHGHYENYETETITTAIDETTHNTVFTKTVVKVENGNKTTWIYTADTLEGLESATSTQIGSEPVSPLSAEYALNGDKVTNTKETVTKQMIKQWKNADGTTTAPDNIRVTLTLYKRSIDPNDSTKYVYEPVTIDGTQNERAVVLNGLTDVFTTAGTVSRGEEKWTASANSANIVPGTQANTFEPSADTEEAKAAAVKAQEDAATAYESYPWYATWKNLDEVDASGNPIVYVAKETKVERNTGTSASPSWTDVTSAFQSNEYEISYKEETMTTVGGTEKAGYAFASGTVTNTQKTVEVKVQKKWESLSPLGQNDAPNGADVEFTLCKMVTNPESGTNEPEPVPVTVKKSVLRDGKIVEEDVPNVISLNGTTDGTVSHGNFTKADGETTGSVNAYEYDSWKAQWSNLPACEQDGTPITYVIQETKGQENYSVVYSGAESGSGAPTHTYSAKNASATGDNPNYYDITNKQESGTLKLTKAVKLDGKEGTEGNTEAIAFLEKQIGQSSSDTVSNKNYYVDIFTTINGVKYYVAKGSGTDGTLVATRPENNSNRFSVTDLTDSEITNLPIATYIVQEDTGSIRISGYDLKSASSTTAGSVTLVTNPDTTNATETTEDDNTAYLTNDYTEKTAEVLLRKKKEDGTSLDGAAFQLYKITEDSGQQGGGQQSTETETPVGQADVTDTITMQSGKTETGAIAFANLKAGTYVLREVNAPEGYSKVGDIRFVIGPKSSSDDTLEVTNYPGKSGSAISSVANVTYSGTDGFVFEAVDKMVTELEVAKVWFKNNQYSDWDDQVGTITLSLTRYQGNSQDTTFGSGTNHEIKLAVSCTRTTSGEGAGQTVTENYSVTAASGFALPDGVTGTVEKQSDATRYLIKLSGFDKQYLNNNELTDYGYRITEEKPQGYKDPEYGWIGDDGGVQKFMTAANTPKPSYADLVGQSGTAAIYNAAEDAVELPSTGGSGVGFVYLMGLALVLASGIGLLMNRRRNTV
ncbi:MAG: Cna B-type domain-containing protein [Lachnospiraceae bacterium]|nr:Cna B-type domain-containing protein [Lachnospiraceae bacterium]